MIIKSAQRAGARELAFHLMKEIDIAGGKQDIVISDARYLMQEKNVFACLEDMELIAKVSPRCQKHLYHISVSPNAPMSDADWTAFWQTYEAEFGLENLAYIEVTHDHENHDRPAHKHRVYERVDVALEKAVELSFTKVRNEKVARMMEYHLGHSITIGKHNRAVMLQLEKEGRAEITAWMQKGGAGKAERPVAEKSHDDHQQEARTKLSIEQVKADLQEAWGRADNGKAFEAAIAEKGYGLVRGDRRDFVIIDPHGGIHSPRRRLKVKAKEIKERWADLLLEHLPTVEDWQNARRTVPKKQTLDEKLQALFEKEQATRQEIASLEAALEKEQAGGQGSTPDTFIGVAAEAVYSPEIAKVRKKREDEEEEEQQAQQNADHRRLIEQLQHWQQQSHDPERSKPQEHSALWTEAESWGISKATLKALKLEGQAADRERDKRIEQVLTEEPASPPEAVNTYRISLGQRLKAKGRRYYRYADRWLTQRLARLGYSKTRTRQVLAEASPALMDEALTQRISYIRRLVERVYTYVKTQDGVGKEKRAKSVIKDKHKPVGDRSLTQKQDITQPEISLENNPKKSLKNRKPKR